MKKIVLIMMVAIASINAMANTYPTLNVEGKRSFTLELNDWQNEDLFITIVDEAGEVMHSENVDEAGIARKYSLENLPIGFYKMTIADQLKDIAFNIFVTYEGVTVNNAGKVYFRPFVKNTDEIIDINLLTMDKKVLVNLMDSDGNIIYSEKTDKIMTYQKRLDISNLPSGIYSLNLFVEGRTYTNRIEK
jgi:hypothetical protein